MSEIYTNEKYFFRGKTIETKKWTYGYYVKSGQLCFIVDYIDGKRTEVIPDSVGISIKRKDKNNKLIFEGDYIKFRKHPEKARLGIVKMCEEGYMVIFSDGIYRNLSGINQIEVVGNIHDHLIIQEHN